MPPKQKRCAYPPNRPAKSGKIEKVKYRCSPEFLTPIMKLINGNDKQKGHVEEIGFGSFLSMADADADADVEALTLWLVDKFNCDNEALEFEGGISIPVRLLVKSVLGIPSGPIQVLEGLDVDDALYHQYTCNHTGKTAEEVAYEMRSITDKEPFCVAFMMVILATYLAPKTSLRVNRKLLVSVKQVDKLKEMDWCNFVATCLFKGIKEFRESNTSFIYIKGCVHILSVIFIDFVKHAAFDVPVGFPRLGVVTAKHFESVVSHPFTSLTVCRPEESIYAAVLDNMPKENIFKDGKCVDSETNTDALSKKHPVSGELGTAITSPNTTCWAIVEHAELGISSRSAGHIHFPRSGGQVQSSRPSELCSAQIIEMMHVAPDAPKEMNSGSTSLMENAVDQSAKKARVDRPSSVQAKRAGGVPAVDLSVLNCTFCCRPLKPPVFQCNGGHLACNRCLVELPGEQCQKCKHGGSFGRNLAMDADIKLAGVRCSHDGCSSIVPYDQLDDHERVCPHARCFCSEPGCGFAGPPQALLSHLNALHSVPVHKVHYGEDRQLRVSEPRFLLQGVGDDSVFVLSVGALGPTTVLSVACIRVDTSSRPQYMIKISASSVAGSIKMELQAVTSSSSPPKVAVEELPRYLAGSGASKEVTLTIRIDKL